MHSQTIPTCRRNEFARVVAVRAADDDDHIALLREFNSGSLPLLCRLANRVNETNFGVWKALTDELNQRANFFNRLRRLRRDAETWTLLQHQHVRLGQHDIKLL